MLVPALFVALDGRETLHTGINETHNGRLIEPYTTYRDSRHRPFSARHEVVGISVSNILRPVGKA